MIYLFSVWTKSYKENKWFNWNSSIDLAWTCYLKLLVASLWHVNLLYSKRLQMFSIVSCCLPTLKKKKTSKRYRTWKASHPKFVLLYLFIIITIIRYRAGTRWRPRFSTDFLPSVQLVTFFLRAIALDCPWYFLLFFPCIFSHLFFLLLGWVFFFKSSSSYYIWNEWWISLHIVYSLSILLQIYERHHVLSSFRIQILLFTIFCYFLHYSCNKFRLSLPHRIFHSTSFASSPYSSGKFVALYYQNWRCSPRDVKILYILSYSLARYFIFSRIH